MTATAFDECEVEAHRVAPKLWIGSALPLELACQRAPAGVDLLVLCAREDQYERDLSTLNVPLDDTEEPMPRVETVMAVEAARTINLYRANGKRVLVTCHAGVNRSSFVAALALIESGWTPSGAIDAIREHRKPPNGMMPLSNRRFVEMLRAFGDRRLHAYGGLG